MIINKANVLFEARSTNLYDTWVKAQGVVKSETLHFKWKAGRITHHVWGQIINFFKDHPDHEVQVRLYYHVDEGMWTAWAYPQNYPSGMSTKELDAHPEFAEQTLQFKDHVLFGSVHHHCDMSAFQSGTDSNDEDKNTGLHITLGNLKAETWSWHHRLSVGNTYQEIKLDDWFELDDWSKLDHCPTLPSWAPATMQLDLLKAALTKPELYAEVEYPEQWKTNLIKPAYVHTPTQAWRQGHRDFDQIPTAWEKGQPKLAAEQETDGDLDESYRAWVERSNQAAREERWTAEDNGLSECLHTPEWLWCIWSAAANCSCIHLGRRKRFAYLSDFRIALRDIVACNMDLAEDEDMLHTLEIFDALKYHGMPTALITDANQHTFTKVTKADENGFIHPEPEGVELNEWIIFMT